MPLQAAIREWLTPDPFGYVETHQINGHPVLRTKAQLPRPEQPAGAGPTAPLSPAEPPAVPPAVPPVVAPRATPAPVVDPKAVPTKPTPKASTPRTGIRRVAKEWLPPAVHRAISERRDKANS